MSESEQGKVAKSSNNKLLISLVSAAVIAAFLGGYVFASEFNPPQPIIIQNAEDVIGPTRTQPTQPQTGSTTLFISLDDDPIKGNPDAEITIVEFSDFQCPFCERFHRTTLPLLEQNYLSTGKVNFVYRDFPIQGIHPNAVPAALASECADDQGKFWEYHDLLFVNQKNWQDLEIPVAVNTFKQYASSLDLDMQEFNDCFESGKYLAEINADLEDGRQYGVTGTPGFFVGNEKTGFTRIIGAQPYSVFQEILNEKLSN
ncbi:MAG: DsbA family protein [Crenarchaeota archaeon]|nr:MAG: DsbA family protein [Thermoproteota archaeon]RDJ33989.1 MAG: DsbA family protein [Thermoproteota archaeon]RDJ37568.1 MAG: DsbA family protein [Thermoproteota archaeon]